MSGEKSPEYRWQTLVLLMLLTGCATSPSERRLSSAEMERYQLHGILNEARICPTVFDDQTKASVVVGDCEIVSCDHRKGRTTCWARPEKTKP
ncbi:MAG: hypothetical protein COT73_03220 [Bdellovibrio sp. CG10_big_fil_rev_8_21_14_0_10_47_8]|nr:MAG: hypothetical protein COT73_03220 [Bdellovibrio sp. CG10_big_fil_rev_8_21_14_0_10_47_8]